MRVWQKTLVWVMGGGVIGAVVFPVFVPVQTGGHKVPTCLSHVKQLAVAMMIYQSDFDERLPRRERWMDATSDYTKNPELYRCPLVAESGWGCAFNASLGGKDPKVVGEPAGLEMVYDSFKTHKNASDRVTSLPRPGRHEGKNHIAYADGHAKAVEDT